ncbi:efflux RND transporter periplasmic adaptor subunit [Thioalkalivibrio sp. ALJ24]|uniref:efflux RND transporter periplasmic adaptor subunit n=1 Tax=Thioalkalivibrio sp. ALJ24 TaxID=545276 RepID=UPI00036930E5|nr:efflux RND transporter periplasmic adaptor subunit [Thioalkalivibrio sp. ALJ24]
MLMTGTAAAQTGWAPEATPRTAPAETTGVHIAQPLEAERRTVSGTVIPFREVTLRAQSGGRVVSVEGEEGERFETDEKVAAISDERLQAQRQAALAEMRTTEAAIREARMHFDREVISPRSEDIGQMPGMGMPAMMDQMITRDMGQFMGFGDPTLDRTTDLFSRHIGVDQAQARWEQARARVEELDVALEETRSRAPFDGVIMHKHVEPGDTVQPGHPLLTMGYLDYLRVEAAVPVRLVRQLEVGDMVAVTLDGEDEEIQARVSRIFPLADPHRHTVTVKFDLPQEVRAGPGMYAEVHLPGDAVRDDRVVIPESAIIPGGALPRVAVLGDDDQVRIRTVRLGAARDGGVVVTSGLQPGARVLSNPRTRH